MTLAGSITQGWTVLPQASGNHAVKILQSAGLLSSGNASAVSKIRSQAWRQLMKVQPPNRRNTIDHNNIETNVTPSGD
jgi:hypothetical protein